MFARSLLRSPATLQRCHRSVPAFIQTRWGSGHAAHAAPAVPLLDVLKQHFPGQSDMVTKRWEQLKRNHMQYLSLDVNWNTYKPEQQAEFMRDLEDVIKSGYHTMTPEQKKAVSLTNVDKLELDKVDFHTLDNILQKTEELQLGDWKKMSLAEKKAAYYLAWGPLPTSNTEFTQQVSFRIGLFLAASALVYYALFKYFRSQKNLPSLTPEFKEAARQRLIKERANPYTGESAHLFTKDGIKSE